MLSRHTKSGRHSSLHQINLSTIDKKMINREHGCCENIFNIGDKVIINASPNRILFFILFY
jgi:hypothetical protein